MLLFWLDCEESCQVDRILLCQRSTQLLHLPCAFKSWDESVLHYARHVFQFHFRVDAMLRWRNCTFENYLELLQQYFTHFLVCLASWSQNWSVLESFLGQDALLNAESLTE